MVETSPPPLPAFLPAPRDQAFISKGYDATTHFETTVDDVLDMYRRITGRDLDLTAKEPVTVGEGGRGAWLTGNRRTHECVHVFGGGCRGPVGTAGRFGRQ